MLLVVPHDTVVIQLHGRNHGRLLQRSKCHAPGPAFIEKVVLELEEPDLHRWLFQKKRSRDII